MDQLLTLLLLTVYFKITISAFQAFHLFFPRSHRARVLPLTSCPIYPNFLLEFCNHIYPIYFDLILLITLLQDMVSIVLRQEHIIHDNGKFLNTKSLAKSRVDLRSLMWF